MGNITKKLKDVGFICYKYTWSKGIGTLFLFYPDGQWDDDKLTLNEALKNYPPKEYNWIHINDSSV